ncbi:SecY-interacting protein Syd [Flexilinea flocculi]|uniref:Syd protein n=1 Tax=Flexilinea flocculi TaxID=1678840 RepID=A0A0S7BV53_9CHLR|nr:SecY-interacting protein Syd [Flexilinea flocculi]NMC35175.1 hypothetical protein [Veillonellaceae bacterium]GAP40239.1 Syd protein [Flexilinea flocculi]
MKDMKNAFEEYFKKLINFSKQTYGAKPTVTFTNGLNKELLVSKSNEEGEVEWLPQLQNIALPWNEIEGKVGFMISKELREYYTTFLFLNLSGKYGGVYLYFQPLSSQEEILRTIFRQYSDAQSVFPHSKTFLIGSANYYNDDGYHIFYDNSDLKTFCYESDTKKEILLSYSLAEVISTMEAFE